MGRFGSSNWISYQSRYLMCSTWVFWTACWFRLRSRWFRERLLRMHYIFVCSIRPVAEGDVLVLRAFAWEWWALVSFPAPFSCVSLGKVILHSHASVTPTAQSNALGHQYLWATLSTGLKRALLNNLVLCQSCQEEQCGESILRCILQGRCKFQTLG